MVIVAGLPLHHHLAVLPGCTKAIVQAIGRPRGTSSEVVAVQESDFHVRHDAGSMNEADATPRGPGMPSSSIDGARHFVPWPVLGPLACKWPILSRPSAITAGMSMRVVALPNSIRPLDRTASRVIDAMQEDCRSLLLQEFVHRLPRTLPVAIVINDQDTAARQT